MPDTIVLVCGSLRWTNAQPVEARLAKVHDRVGRSSMIVVHGDTLGVDKIAADWCERWHVTHIKFEADYAAHGRFAPRDRYNRMLDFALDHRDDMGAEVEMAVFRLPDDLMSAEVDRFVDRASHCGLTGSIVSPAA